MSPPLEQELVPNSLLPHPPPLSLQRSFTSFPFPLCPDGLCSRCLFSHSWTMWISQSYSSVMIIRTVDIYDMTPENTTTFNIKLHMGSLHWFLNEEENSPSLTPKTSVQSGPPAPRLRSHHVLRQTHDCTSEQE